MPHTDWKVADAATPVITVEAVAEGRWLAHAGDRALAFERAPDAFDGEPRVLDEDLGAFAEMAQPRNIRVTIEALRKEDQNFNPLAVRTNSVQTGGRPTTKYLLTEVEANYVLMHLRTPKARACKWLFARMAAAVRSGTPALGPEIVTMLRAEIARLTATYDTRIRELEAQRAAAPVYLTPRERGAQLRALLGQYAAKMHRLHPSVSLRGWRKRAEDRVRDIVAYPRGLAHTLDAMPFDLWERAMLHATALNTAVSALLPRGVQLDLPPARPN